jgi:type IV secretory pathway TrbF-like protein
VAKSHSTAVTVTSIVPIARHSYQVRFVERYFDRNGFRISDMPDTAWIALLHTQISSDPGQDLNNPAGVEITAIQWSQEALPGEGQR